MYELKTTSSWDKFRNDIGQRGWDTGGAPGGGAARQSRWGRPDEDLPLEDRRDWSILLRTFEGRKHGKEAARFVKQLRKEANMSDLWTKVHEGRTYVYRDKFMEPASFAAQDALRQTRLTQLDEDRPFRSVELARIVQDPIAAGAAKDAAVTAEMDLHRYANQDLYSLQVCVYDETFGKGYRDEAEKYAAVLRADGDQAFFCHEKYMSMVTIGLFTREQAFTNTRVDDYLQEVYSPVVRQLQEKHPYNLLNGVTIVEKSRGRRLGEQASSLVRF